MNGIIKGIELTVVKEYEYDNILIQNSKQTLSRKKDTLMLRKKLKL